MAFYVPEEIREFFNVVNSGTHEKKRFTDICTLLQIHYLNRLIKEIGGPTNGLGLFDKHGEEVGRVECIYTEVVDQTIRFKMEVWSDLGETQPMVLDFLQNEFFYIPGSPGLVSCKQVSFNEHTSHILTRELIHASLQRDRALSTGSAQPKKVVLDEIYITEYLGQKRDLLNARHVKVISNKERNVFNGVLTDCIIQDVLTGDHSYIHSSRLYTEEEYRQMKLSTVHWKREEPRFDQEAFKTRFEVLIERVKELDQSGIWR